MSKREQRRAWVLSRVEAEEMSVAEAARLLGLTERSVRRLRARMRLAGIEDRDGSNAFLGRYLARHNRRFAVSPTEPEPAWRRMPGGMRIDRVRCFKYRRTIARDGTVRAGAIILQVPPRPDGRSRAGQRVELHVRLDGRLVIWDGRHELLSTPAPVDVVQLRARRDRHRSVILSALPFGLDPPICDTTSLPP